MKKLTIYLVMTLAFLVSSTYGQKFKKLNKLKFDKESDYKIAKSNMVKFCDYYLSLPCSDTTTNLTLLSHMLYSIPYLVGHYIGSDINIYDILEGDFCLFNKYSAALNKVSFGKKIKINSKELQIEAITIFLEYCKIHPIDDALKQELKPYYDALENGTLHKIVVPSVYGID